MSDDYLFEKRGEPDREIERLEKLLARYRFDPAKSPWVEPAKERSPEPTTERSSEARAGARDAPSPSLRPRARLPRVLLALAAAAVLALAIGSWYRHSTSLGVPSDSPSRGYRLIGVAGRDRVRPGEEIVTGDRSQATLEIGLLGEVELRPNTHLRVEIGDDSQHGFFLDRGSVHAKIRSEPRRFQIGTPAGRSIDLGCEYSIEVGDDGASRLHVLTGQVAFEFDGREVYVPAGATCTSDKMRGPSAPVFDDAAEEFKQALQRVESSSTPPAGALERVLAFDRAEALSVWHLFDSNKTSPEVRRAIYDRLSRAFAKPEGVTEDGLLAGDRSMCEAWLESMKPWWR
jgi:ferric-dicitrate binding protein FerR (iron transport regulator)